MSDTTGQCGKRRFDSAHMARSDAARVKSRKTGSHRLIKLGHIPDGERSEPRAYHWNVCGFWHWGNTWGGR